MNRLVLIGNGFDLAHGLKTRYEDFINWYWKQRILHMCEETTSVSDDHLCKLTTLQNDARNLFVFNNNIALHQSEGKDIYKYLVENKELYNVENRYLFERIHQSIESKGWVDIENDYYSLLCNRIAPLNGYTATHVKFINTQLEIVRNLLVKYLRLEEDKDAKMIDTIKDKIYRRITKREISVGNLSQRDNTYYNQIDRVLLLSFNYTKTPLLYMSDNTQASINYIHGNLDNPQGIIFGYGDELDSDFNRLKELNENECLRHMKSIRYLESDNYRKMLEFIESAPFQVCIMGHSCGNSDRTLLNTLFEHKNCVSIKPYYYVKDDKADNYLELVQNISRNFTDMKLMRDRVVNKTYCEPLTNRNNN